MQLIKDGLERSVAFEVRDDSAEGGDGLNLSGHAAVFNVLTEINSWEGSFQEQIAPGAFKKTIRERTPVMQFDHGRHPLIGSIPIGSISSLREDDIGLAVEGRLTDNWLIQPVRDAIVAKTVNGMSFRFDVIREEWADKDGKVLRDAQEIMNIMWDPDNERGPLTRTLKELRVHELGPVVFPAYVETDVAVRSVADELMKNPKAVNVMRSGLIMETEYKPADREHLSAVAYSILFRGMPVKPLVKPLVPLINIDELTKEVRAQQILAELTSSKIDAPVRDDHPSEKENILSAFAQTIERNKLILGNISEG